MRGEASQPNAIQTPAIVLYGGPLSGVDDNRRREIAAHLADLLGVQAEVRQIDTAGDQESATDQVEPPELIPPFSLLINEGWNEPDGRNKYIDVANARSPGIIENDIDLKRALFAVFYRPYRQAIAMDSEFLSYHFEDSSEPGGRKLRGITFIDPQMFAADPEKLQKNIARLGPKGVVALVQFVTAITRVPEHS